MLTLPSTSNDTFVEKPCPLFGSTYSLSVSTELTLIESLTFLPCFWACELSDETLEGESTERVFVNAVGSA